jgi:CDP-glucose 4,6-dehydratase
VRREFWQGKSVFLTGHTGFKGSWMSLWLTEMGARVTGYALAPPTEPNMFTVCSVDRRMNSIIADVRDEAVLTKTMLAVRPDIVIHMAAQPLVRYSYAHPVETYSTNVMGTVHLLEAVRRYGHAAVTLIVTSDKCYENREHGIPYREDDAMGGHDPYSNSKGCAELVTRAYGNSYFAVDKKLGALASVRAGNVIGGGDWAGDRLVPDIIRALAKNESPIIRHPTAVRPWQHVLEPLSGYLAAIEYCATGNATTPDAWNFAPDAQDQIPVKHVAELLCDAWGNGIRPTIQPQANAVHEAHLLTLDAAKAKRELHWHPCWDIATTLARTAQWYHAYHEGAAMEAFSIAQINDYTKTY